MEQDVKFENSSYQRHERHMDAYRKGGEEGELGQGWLKNDTADAWRHERMYQNLSPLICENESWLTVGDGRYGLDAQFLASRGCNTLATDISGTLLKEAYDAGRLSAYQVENAESLSFEDGRFDYVLCKEAYHHCPRPMCALYEALRVSKKAVVLIEPSDHEIEGSPLDSIIDFLRKIVGRPVSSNTLYESSGNYAYRISRREIEKVALELNYPVIAFKGINDYYHPDMLNEQVADNGPLLRRAKKVIAVLDALGRLKLRDYRMVTAIVFKGEISESVEQALVQQGFSVHHLPRNPYI